MRSILAAAAAFAVLTSPAVAQTYDAFDSFDGFQNAGGFFYGTLNPADFNNAPQFQFSCAIGDFCLTNGNPVADTPIAFKSLTAFTLGSVIVPDDRLVLHPGQTDNLAVAIVFLVPNTASYRIDTLFSVQDIRPTGVGISLFYNPSGAGLDDATLVPVTSLNAGNPSFSGSSIRQLASGDIIGFVIDRQGDFSFDSTGVDFTLTVVPEPASWALMIAGFGVVGAALRRKLSIRAPHLS